MKITKAELAKMIDSTNVKSTATKSEIRRLCKEAVEYGFGCVCVNPTHVKFAATLLRGSPVQLSSTVGFPFGASLPEVKALEAVRAVEDGATELDTVINLSALKSRDYAVVMRDLVTVMNVKQLFQGTLVKVIIETPLLTNTEKVKACNLVTEAGADFVKTSTGFFGRTTVEDVRLLRKTVGDKAGVKAAGGIRTYADALAMVKAGANRIGTSTAAAIVRGAPANP
jgi:deoxyribose-phosphate aldolase